MKILVVEDDRQIAELVDRMLTDYNYAVDIAADGAAGLAMAEAFTYDLIISDVGLPKLDGVALCQRLRELHFENPILLLTGQDGSENKAIALNAGADDYVVKPFDAVELIARVQALLRRPAQGSQPILTWGDLVFDPNTRQVSYGDSLRDGKAERPLKLTPKEYAILELLLRNPRSALSSTAILDRVWTADESPADEVVRTHIKELRHKFIAVGAPKDLIKTVHRVGYQLNPAYADPAIADTSMPKDELAAVRSQLQAVQAQLAATQAELDRRNRESHRDTNDPQWQQIAAKLPGMAYQYVLHADGTDAITYVSPKCREIYELEPEDLLADLSCVWSMVHPDDLKTATQLILDSARTLERFDLESRLVMPSGKIKWVRTGSEPQRLANGDTLWDGFVTDISRRKHAELERERAELQLQQQLQQECLLADIAQDIRQTLDLHCVLSNTVERVRALLATDRVVIFYFRPDWEGEIVAESVGVGWMPTLGEIIVDPCLPNKWLEPYRQGRVSAIEDIENTAIAACHVELLRSFQVKANLVVPILQGDKLWGLLIAHHCTAPRQWHPQEVALLQRIAIQVGIASQQSQLFADLQLSQKRQTFLLKLNDRLRDLADPEEIQFVAATTLGEYLGANRVGYVENGADNETITVTHNYTNGVFGVEGCYRYKDYGAEVLREYQAGRAVVCPDIATDPKLTPPEKAAYAVQQVGATASIPMMKAGRLVAVLFTHYQQAHEFSEAELELMGEVAVRTWDAVERARAEAALRASEAKYRSLFNSLDAGFCLMEILFDAHEIAYNYRFLDINAAFAAQSGLTDAAGKTILELVPNLEPQWAEQYGRVAKSGKAVRFEADVPSMNRVFDIYAFPYGGSDKHVIAVLFTDITERRQSQQKIQEQAALLDIATDAIFVRDLEHRILYWNRGAERLYGWTAAETIGQTATELLGENPAKVAENTQAVFDLGEWRGEIQNVTKAGAQVIIEGCWTLVRAENGQPKFILCVNTDITAKKSLETQFYHAQRLESLGTLASGIAHDLNNALTPILAFAQILRSQPSIDQKTQGRLQIIEDSARRGADMVKQILTFARGTIGQRTALPIDRLLDDVITVAQQTFPKSIVIERHLANDLWLVTGDATQLHQVCLNLCVNARDAMPDGGTLTISATNHVVDELFARSNLNVRAGNYVLVTIADTGVGIPPEIIDRIFDPFFTTKSIGEGTGLGLATVIGIVNNHGGFVRVASTVGQGTEFKIYLPAASEGETIDPNRGSKLIDGSNQLVLIVDDDPVVRTVNQSLLEEHHYRTLTANDGVAAIATYAQHKSSIDLVLIDAMMPNLGGAAAIRAMHQMNPQVKILAISGLSSNQAPMLEAGARVFLAKPYQLDELLKTLSELLNS